MAQEGYAPIPQGQPIAMAPAPMQPVMMAPMPGVAAP